MSDQSLLLENETESLLERVIPSQEMREFLKKTGHRFSDREKATIFWCSRLRRSEIHDCLVHIAKQTDDGELKRQIVQRLEYDEKAEQKFLEDREGYVYTLDVCDPEICPEENIIGYYSDPVLAVDAGKGSGFPFVIRKHQIIRPGEPVIPARDYYFGSSHPRLPAHEGVSYARYDKDGNMRNFWSYELPAEEDEAVYEGLAGRFELAYVSIPHPFETGDRVIYIGNKDEVETEDRVGTVLSSQSDWQKVDQAARLPDRLIDWFDASVTVMFGTDPLLDHDHISPIYLEHYPNTGNPKKIGEKDV